MRAPATHAEVLGRRECLAASGSSGPPCSLASRNLSAGLINSKGSDMVVVHAPKKPLSIERGCQTLSSNYLRKLNARSWWWKRHDREMAVYRAAEERNARTDRERLKSSPAPIEGDGPLEDWRRGHAALLRVPNSTTRPSARNSFKVLPKQSTPGGRSEGGCTRPLASTVTRNVRPPQRRRQNRPC